MTSQANVKTALVVGVTGSFGLHAAEALIKHGWRVRALARDPAAAAAKLGARTPIEWTMGDAMDAASFVRAAEGASLIVHAANPPAYRNWKGAVLPMIDSAIAAARASGARIAIAGSVYNFAPDAGAHIAEDAAQQPATRKGAIRVEVERRLRAASETGVKVLVLRSGDFFGPASSSGALSWLTRLSRGKLAGVYQPGPGDVGHAYAYLPDLGETLARLADAEARLGDFEVFHFGGCYLERSVEMVREIGRAVGRPDLRPTPFPWWMVRLASPFNETFRELLEMRYLWRRPIGLDNAKLVAFLGEEPHTPFATAIRATLADMGVLGAADAAQTPASRSSSAMAPAMW